MTDAVITLNARSNAEIANSKGDEMAARALAAIARRKDTLSLSQSRFEDLCDRFDNWYYPNEITTGGADHWPEDPNRRIIGKAHVSVNVAPTYVDVPAALQAVTPIENIVAGASDEESRNVANAVERLYFTWKEEIAYETKFHKIATVKSLYGRCYAKVAWDYDLKLPQIYVVEQPRNLWMGYASNDYERPEWAIYSYVISAEQAMAEYGLDVDLGEKDDDGLGVVQFAYTRQRGGRANDSNTDPRITSRDWLYTEQQGMVEVNDYWFREPKSSPVKGQRTEMQTHNVITVGADVVEDAVHPEYAGMIPYIPIFNTFIPGTPEGRPDLYDVEQLLREKDERISAGGTMVSKLVGKQFWQLTGPEAPDSVPAGLRPRPDQIVAPGAGNRIEAISPWMPEYQLETYLGRIDRELQDVSGLNDLLRGLAPAQVLSSGKAINALVAEYETRITLRRQMFYQWRFDVWEMAKMVWGHMVPEAGFAKVLDSSGRLVLKPPTLTPRDDLEQSNLAMNLLQGKVWSQSRAMDHTGVEDPQAEQDIVRNERQDPALFPQDVQAQVALIAMQQQIQIQNQQLQAQAGPQQDPGDAEAQVLDADEARRQAADEGRPDGNQALQGEGEQPVGAEEGSAFRGRGDFNAVNQSKLQGGQVTNRSLFQQPLTSGGLEEEQ